MDDIVCVECKYIGKPKMRRRGSGKWEVMGWTVFFPLGVPYTIWRMLARVPSCRHCKGTLLLDADSAAGQRLIKIAAGETVYDVAPPMSNVENPNEPRAKILHEMESQPEPVMTTRASTPAIPDVKPEPVKEPGPAPKPMNDPKPPTQPSPPPVAPEPTPPAEQVSERSVRMDPNVW